MPTTGTMHGVKDTRATATQQNQILSPAFALALLAITAFAPAQELATTGKVVDEEGRPIAFATVTFAAPIERGGLLSCNASVKYATTFDDGRFRIPLRAGQPYSVWACGPDTPAGRLCSLVREGVAAGAELTLTADMLRASTPVRVEELDALGDGPFMLEVRAKASSSPVWRLGLDATGAVALPAMPAIPFGPGWAARILDANGRVVVTRPLATNDSVIPLPARSTNLVVRDDKGAAVAGARVFALVQAPAAYPERALSFRPGPTHDSWLGGEPTDAEGNAQLILRDRTDLWFADTPTASAAHAVGMFDGIWSTIAADLRGYEEAPAVTPVQLQLRGAPPLAITVRRGDRPVTGIGLTLHARFDWQRDDGDIGGSGSIATTMDGQTAADGTWRADTVPRPIAVLQIGVDDFHDVPTAVLPRLEVPAAPIPIDLHWQSVTWQVQAPNGAAAKNARLLLWPAVLTRTDIEPLEFTTDAEGRARIRMEPGAWFAVATDGLGIATALHTANGEAGSHALQLAPLTRFAGRVLDAAGQPAANIGFVCGEATGDGLPTDAPLLERLLQRHEPTINAGLTRGIASAADGRFEMRCLLVPGITRLWGPWPPRPRRPQLPLAANDAVEFRLPQ